MKCPSKEIDKKNLLPPNNKLSIVSLNCNIRYGCIFWLSCGVFAVYGALVFVGEGVEVRTLRSALRSSLVQMRVQGRFSLFSALGAHCRSNMCMVHSGCQKQHRSDDAPATSSGSALLLPIHRSLWSVLPRDRRHSGGQLLSGALRGRSAEARTTNKLRKWISVLCLP